MIEPLESRRLLSHTAADVHDHVPDEPAAARPPEPVVEAIEEEPLSGFPGAVLALGIVLPGMLLQDCWRYAFFAAGKGHHSFLNDLAWGLASRGVAVVRFDKVTHTHAALVADGMVPNNAMVVPTRMRMAGRDTRAAPTSLGIWPASFAITA